MIHKITTKFTAGNIVYIPKIRKGNKAYDILRRKVDKIKITILLNSKIEIEYIIDRDTYNEKWLFGSITEADDFAVGKLTAVRLAGNEKKKRPTAKEILMESYSPKKKGKIKRKKVNCPDCGQWEKNCQCDEDDDDEDDVCEECNCCISECTCEGPDDI